MLKVGRLILLAFVVWCGVGQTALAAITIATSAFGMAYPLPFYQRGPAMDATLYPVVFNDSVGGSRLRVGLSYSDGSYVNYTNDLSFTDILGTAPGTNVVYVRGPVGGPYKIRISDYDTGTNLVFSDLVIVIGNAVVFAGQSDVERMCIERTAAPPTPHAQARFWNLGSWASLSTAGDGAVMFLNTLIARTGEPWAIVCVGKGGTSLTRDEWITAGSSASGYHLDTVTTHQPWQNTIAGFNALMGRVPDIMWAQGESSLLNVRLGMNHHWRGLEQLRVNWRSLINADFLPILQIMLVPLGHYYEANWGSGVYADQHHIHDAHRKLARMHPEKVYLGPPRYDLPIGGPGGDYTHVDVSQAGVWEHGIRLANEVWRHNYSGMR